MIRIGFVGSRDFQNEFLVRSLIKGLPTFTRGRPFVVVSGGAYKRSPEYRMRHPHEPIEGGVDYWAEEEADANGYDKDIIYAEWMVYGKKAGMIRNEILVRSCDIVFIFWDGFSSGTRNVMKNAKTMEKRYKVYGELSAPEYPVFT